jgi:hypothetical protein
MLSLIMWFVGISLESVILFRAFRVKMLGTYPMFYMYIACVLGTEISRYIVYRHDIVLYDYVWWGTDFLCLLVGYFVIFDIFEKGLEAYEGIKRFARVVGLVVLAGIVAFTAFQLLSQNRWSKGLTSVEVERNLRAAELVLLGGILVLVAYYRIRLGRNLKGIILGYGLYVAVEVMSNATRSFVGESFQNAFSTVRSYTYLASLMIWTVALWAYHPNPVPKRPGGGMGGDYQAMATKTKNALGEVRSHLDKGGRP